MKGRINQKNQMQNTLFLLAFLPAHGMLSYDEVNNEKNKYFLAVWGKVYAQFAASLGHDESFYDLIRLTAKGFLYCFLNW